MRLYKVIAMIGVAAIVTLFATTVSVFLFDKSFQYSQPSSELVQPHEQIAQSTQFGKRLLELQSKIESNPNSVKQGLIELDRQIRESSSAIEKIYFRIVERELAVHQKDQQTIDKVTTQLLTIADENSIDWVEPYIQSEDAYARLRAGEYLEGIALIERAISSFEAHGRHYLLLKAYNTAGILYNANNQLKQSQLHFYKGIELGKSYPSSIINGRLNNNLGLLYVHLEQWDKAITYLDNARKINETSGKRADLLAVIWLNESFVYNRLGDLQSSQYAFEQALPIVEQSASPFIKVIKYKAQARLHLLRAELDKAAAVSRECVELALTQSYPKQEGICYFILAKAQLARGDLADAEDTASQALSFFSEINHTRWLIRANLLMAEVYEKQGRAKEALELYKEYREQQWQQMINEVYALEFAFDTRQLEQERDLLSAQGQLNMLELSKEKLRLRIALIWGHLLFLLSWLSFVTRIP